MGPWCYGVRVEETRKELSYLNAMGAVTNEGNFNIVVFHVVNLWFDHKVKLAFL